MNKILTMVFFALFWAAISYFTHSDIGIYAGLACIYELNLTTPKE